MSRRKTSKKSSLATRSGISAYMRRPVVQLGVIAIVALIIYLIASSAGGAATTTGSEISVDEAYQKFQAGGFLLDVRTQEEWDDYHVEGSTFIPLDELPNRLSELPKDQEIVVICHSGNRSKPGRDILLDAGFNATSVTGGLLAWYEKNYPLFTTGPVQ